MGKSYLHYKFTRFVTLGKGWFYVDLEELFENLYSTIIPGELTNYMYTEILCLR